MSPPRLEESLVFSDGLLRSEEAGLLAFDTECRYTFWNSVMEKITGMTAAEVVGKRATEVFPFIERTGESAYFQKALAGENAVSKNRRYSIAERAREGFFNGYYSPLRDGDGRVIGGVAVIRDITEQKIAEQRLHETENRFKNMADVAPVLLWMSGKDSLCTFFNQTWLDFTGRTLEQEWGVGWAEGIYFEDFQRCMDTYVAAFNAREVFEMEYRLRRHDGEYRWILDRGTPRYGSGGSFEGYIGSCIDITDRKHLETQLVKAVRDRDDFLSIASHELRTPLTTLRLEIESLRRSLVLRPETALSNGQLARNVEVAGTQTTRLVALVENLLDVSRLASGRLEIATSEFDLSDLVSEVVGRLRPALDAARCPIELVELTSTVGVWDRLRLEQVINNLLSNAIKYGAGNPIQVRVTRGLVYARLEVRDHGIGVAPEDQDRIFQRFERAASGMHYGGFGLGLWISREIVMAQGGAIELESTPGKGSTFTVTLPLPS
jgi:PAS domain S-box-containing protein